MEKVAIHVLPYVTRGGHKCLKWVRWYIYLGRNPLGPRGGHRGTCVDAHCVAGPFRNRLDAANHARIYADSMGFELLP